MVGVYTTKFNYRDIRNKFLILKHFGRTWYSPFPWEIFIENKNQYFHFLYSHNINNINTLFVASSTLSQPVQQNLLLTNLNSIFTYIDGSCYKTETNFIYLSSFSCLYTNTRLTFILNNKISSHPTLISISALFLGSQWVERELKEFFNLFIINLSDTRRLLTDYTTEVLNTENYKTTSYDLISQDLYNNRGATLRLFFYVFIFMCRF